MQTAAVQRRRASKPQIHPVDAQRVRVVLRMPDGSERKLGNAQQALSSRHITGWERAAIRAAVRAVTLVRQRAGFTGVDDAGGAVKLLLRDPEATSGGPWATLGQISIGSANALDQRVGRRARRGVLLPVDVAIHELVHVIQFGRMDVTARPHAALLEGMADAAAILATDDATLGEGYFSVGRNGRREGAIRELGHTKVNGPSIGPVVRRYDAIRHDTEPHAAGGVVSSTFLEIRARLGRQAAERLLWAVIRDDAAWRQGGSWREFAQAIQRAAEQLWSSSVRGEIAAVAAAMRATKLDTALA